jgi:hypothetical protein
VGGTGEVAIYIGRTAIYSRTPNLSCSYFYKAALQLGLNGVSACNLALLRNCRYVSRIEPDGFLLRKLSNLPKKPNFLRGVERPSFKTRTTVNNGYLGSRNDEERSEMRYVMRIAELRESSNF